MAEAPEDAGTPAPRETSAPDPRTNLTLEGLDNLVLEPREEGEFRKGTFVVPQATLPENFVLPSAAPIIENPAVQVEQAPQSSTDQTQSDE